MIKIWFSVFLFWVVASLSVLTVVFISDLSLKFSECSQTCLLKRGMPLDYYRKQSQSVVGLNPGYTIDYAYLGVDVALALIFAGFVAYSVFWGINRTQFGVTETPLAFGQALAMVFISTSLGLSAGFGLERQLRLTLPQTEPSDPMLSFTQTQGGLTQDLPELFPDGANSGVYEVSATNTDQSLVTQVMILPPGWETYTSHDGVYSLSYPKDQFVRVNCQNEELVLIKRLTGMTDDVFGVGDCARDSHYDIEIITYERNGYAKLQSYFDQYYRTAKVTTQVGGVTATKYTNMLKPNQEGMFEEYMEQTIIPHGDKEYVVWSSKPENEAIVDQLLQTFRFLK